MTLRPESIKTGDTIGITAPSFGAATEPYSLLYPIALDNIRQRGYNIIEGSTVHKCDGLGISTDPKVCAKELVEFYKRDDIDAIISCGGGELMCETIANIDFEELKGYRPKWFLGYSDNTNFIFPLVTITGVQGIYGPCIGGFAKVWEETEEDSFALLEGTKSSFDGYKRFVEPEKDETSAEESGNEPADIEAPSQKVYTDEELRAPYAYNADRELVNFDCTDGRAVKAQDKELTAEGILLGGCLDILINLCGTRFDRVKDFKKENSDIIWVFEACDMNPITIRRSLWNLREAGWLDGAKGFIIGRPETAWKQEMMGVDQYNAVTDMLEGLGVPIIMDAEIGHMDPMLPIVIGARAKVRAKGNELNIKYIE
jgi:muramoyltetrapeptide carboxypeptidase LdcA involved in peptidoglycan recycling